METVDRRSKLPYNEFIEKYQKTGTAVILEDATEVWEKSIFTPDFFKENFGDRITKYKDKEFTMAEVLDLTAKGTNENPAPYPIKYDIITQLPELLNYMQPLHMNYAKPNWLRSKILQGKLMTEMDLHIGGVGNWYSLHKDIYNVHAWLIQLYGEKEVILFPSGQEDCLYPGKLGMEANGSPIDMSNPDYDKYPKFKNIKKIKETLKAGQVMYIPSGVWHTTMAYQQNISTIIDQMNETNYNGWKRDVYNYKAVHSKPRAMFDYVVAIAIGNACMIGEKMGLKFE